MSMKPISDGVGVIILSVLIGCMAKKTQPTTGDLLGRWKTGTVQTEWGASVLEITFPSASDIEFKMKPVAGGQSIVSKGNYRLRGSQLISAAINKGEPVSVWLEDDQLVIQTPPEPPQRFVRK